MAAAWRAKLNRVSLRVPAPAQPLVDTMRTALAHLLITRDGPVLRPGTRSYARSWIRDGAMISESLLRLGYADVAADYLRWYAPHQFKSGKVPCCVDERGADPVAENDSPGEFIFLVEEIYRYTHDRALLEAMWPHVEAAIQVRRDAAPVRAHGREPRAGETRLLRPHAGVDQSRRLFREADALVLGRFLDAERLRGRGVDRDDARATQTRRRESRHSATSFAATCHASLHASIATHGIAYLPGSAELGDFDPTSTTIAFAPRGDVRDLAPAWVQSTYERYWREFIDRRDGNTAWDVYTPYELRNVGTFIRLGWRDRAQELLAFFLDGRRPAAWHQWPEVVGRDPAKARFVGDMPHAWVASDFIDAVLDLFAYERNDDQSIVLAAGIPPAWLDGAGIGVRNLRTAYGLLSYSLRKEGGRAMLTLEAGSRPPGHFVFVWPWKDLPRATRVNGRAARWQGNELHIDELPARVVVEGFDGGDSRALGQGAFAQSYRPMLTISRTRRMSSSRTNNSRKNRDGHKNRISLELPLGQRNVGISDRGLSPRRWRRTEHLAALRPHARHDSRRRDRRHRVRSLPTLCRRRSADASARNERISLQHLVEQGPATGPGPGESRGPGFLRSAGR